MQGSIARGDGERESPLMMKRAVIAGERQAGLVDAPIPEPRENWVLVKVDESNNTKVKFARSAIHRVLGEEAEAK